MTKTFIVQIKGEPNTRFRYEGKELEFYLENYIHSRVRRITEGPIPTVTVISTQNCSIVLSESELETLAENA